MLSLAWWHCSTPEQLLHGVLDLGVGTRGTRIVALVETVARGVDTDAHLRARARRRGGGRLTSRSSSSRSSLPRTREMSLLLAFGTRRSERRSANIDDAALVEECVETWEGGAAMRGQEGKVSSPLRGRHPSVAPYASCPSACAYEWDSRVSLTP